MFCQFTRQQETNCGLDLPAADRRALVVVSETRRLRSDSFEYVVDERVHDAHRLARNASVGMHLLEHFVDVNAEAFLSPRALLFLLVGRRRFFYGFFVSLGGSHDVDHQLVLFNFCQKMILRRAREKLINVDLCK